MKEAQDPRYIVPGVPIISDAFLDNASGSFSTRKYASLEELELKNPYFAKLIREMSRVRFTGPSYPVHFFGSIAQNSLIEASKRTGHKDKYSLPNVDRVTFERIKNRFSSPLSLIFSDEEHPVDVLNRVNPNLEALLINTSRLFKDMRLPLNLPTNIKRLIEADLGFGLVYDLLSMQNATYKLDDEITA